MKALNVTLAVLVSLLMVLAVLEGGLRLLGFGPPDTGLRFDPQLGWALKPDDSFVNKSREFRAHIATDAHGLRDDYHGAPDKPEGVFRVVCLGDSFTLGYTLDREDLFVDLLEDWWQTEGRKIEVVNAGVQAYSTDQQIAWLQAHGAAWAPDLVLVFPYENDLYWNLKESYAGSSKPVFDDHGARVETELVDHMSRSLLERTALGNKFFKRAPKLERYTVIGTERSILAEQAVLLVEPPPFVLGAERRTAKIFHEAAALCRKLGAKLAVCPIPSHSQVDTKYAAEVMGAKTLKLPRDKWDPALPYAMLRSAAASGADVLLDPLAVLSAAQASGTSQYHKVDWHLAPAGNRTLATFLHDELDRAGLVPAKAHDAALAAAHASGPGVPRWLIVFGVLWACLGTLYVRTYRDEAPLGAALRVGALLATIFTIALGGSGLIWLLPPPAPQVALAAVVITILAFCAYKLGDRLGTAFELLRAFTLRGHWYLMPLLAVLVTVGSLLVVAASSPLVAPFIYTLF